MYLDRQLQLETLKALRKTYPVPLDNDFLIKQLEVGSLELLQTLCYLAEHGLVEYDTMEHPGLRYKSRVDIPEITGTKITAPGLDFLEDDGGLSAILGKVVVKFDEDDFALLISAIELSGASDEEKKNLINMLKSLPSEGAKQLLLQVLTFSLEKTPDLFHLIQTKLGGG